ncbi:MAG TPA: phosphate acyltransferase [Bacteroidaceae bacterium]|nr:phosphate acyltransferase [Bacteroidaceae bacterium]
MEQLKSFKQLIQYLHRQSKRKRMVVVNPVDNHTQEALRMALEQGVVQCIMVGNEEQLSQTVCANNYPENVEIIHFQDVEEAARHAVLMCRNGEADILMKGLINTDDLLRAVLDKQQGILPAGNVMTHISAVEIPGYDKLLFFSDAAVIPRPTVHQRIEIITYAINVCHQFGIEQPRIALTHFTEKVSAKFPISLDYVNIVELAEAGEFGDVLIDGPMDVKSACEVKSAALKGVASCIEGRADVLIFPNIESGNTFYKTVSLFTKAQMAGMLQGTMCPVVLPSRADSSESKFNSIAFAALCS